MDLGVGRGLTISVYDDMEALDRAMSNRTKHLEDRVIKDFLVHTDKNLSTPKKLPVEGEFLSKMFKLLKKSIKPSADEIAKNRRARSAKLSVLERTQ